MKHYVGSQPAFDPLALDPGEAGVYEADDEPLAVYRDDEGELHARSAVCSHMGSLVSWNDGERTRDCPCHGSRFDVDGEVLDTPAVDGLDDVSLSDEHWS
jgi:Rieske Fe-S protein